MIAVQPILICTTDDWGWRPVRLCFISVQVFMDEWMSTRLLKRGTVFYTMDASPSGCLSSVVGVLLCNEGTMTQQSWLHVRALASFHVCVLDSWGCVLSAVSFTWVGLDLSDDGVGLLLTFTVMVVAVRGGLSIPEPPPFTSPLHLHYLHCHPPRLTFPFWRFPDPSSRSLTPRDSCSLYLCCFSGSAAVG